MVQLTSQLTFSYPDVTGKSPVQSGTSDQSRWSCKEPERASQTFLLLPWARWTYVTFNRCKYTYHILKQSVIVIDKVFIFLLPKFALLAVIVWPLLVILCNLHPQSRQFPYFLQQTATHLKTPFRKVGMFLNWHLCYCL